jgi:hypothetical protein
LALSNPTLPEITDGYEFQLHHSMGHDPYEQASYAIQDTPDVVQQHYGRFLPQDKAALAARILNQVWEAA